MCIDPQWMPFESFDKQGNHIGMTAEYFKIFQKDIKIPIQAIQTKTWTESIEAAKARKCDIFSLAMATPERKEYMNFTSPYLSIPLVLATRNGVIFLDDLNYLRGEQIGIVKGYAFNELIRKKYKNIKVVDVNNINEGLQKVANGELFGFIGTLASIGYAIQRNFVGELKIAGKFPEQWKLGIGVRNDDPRLFDILNEEIHKLTPEQKQTILNKYISVMYEQKENYTILLKVLATVFVLALFGIYHYRKLAKINKELYALKEKLQEQANHDPMTNLYNRRYFYAIATDILNLAHRENNALSIMMIDIDLFKQVNDTYGHAVGDMTIKKLAKIMQIHTRKSDIIARLGGEEFAILLPNTDLEGAKKIALNLKNIVEKSSIKLDNNQSLKFTISIGVALFNDFDTIDTALSRADQALYQAKENGRNQVKVLENNSN